MLGVMALRFPTLLATQGIHCTCLRAGYGPTAWWLHVVSLCFWQAPRTKAQAQTDAGELPSMVWLQEGPLFFFCFQAFFFFCNKFSSPFVVDSNGSLNSSGPTIGTQGHTNPSVTLRWRYLRGAHKRK